jgi:hypothetical protein
MRDVSFGFCNYVLPICLSRSYVCLLIKECTHEDSVMKYEGKDQWLCFVSTAQKLQGCLGSYKR